MSVYTRTGDKLTTGLITGRANKGSIRIDSYGTSDEALSYIGSLYSEMDDEKIKSQLETIMTLFFNMGADLANPYPTDAIPFFIIKSNTETIEKYIDEMEKQIPPLTSFIYPIGSPLACKANEIRALVRRCERKIVLLDSTIDNDEKFNKNILPLINRLSDYFFILYRYLNHVAKVEEKVVVFNK